MPLKAAMKSRQKSLGELLRKAKAEAADRPRKARFSPPPLTFTTVSLTPAAKEILDRLTDQATKRTGRKASASSVVRALLHVAEQRDLASTVADIIETELNTGSVVWGKARQD
jgi:hypothetical protein